MIRVLLVAPLDPDVPGDLKFLMGGENTYTRTLISHPPQGVEYVHHDKAMALGQIEYLPVSKFLNLLVKFRILPLSAGSKCFKLRGKFDLVHCHAYSIKLDDPNIPIILSDSSSNYLFLKYYIHWHQWRIKIGYFFKKRLFDWLGVIDADTNLGSCEKLIVFSEFAKRIHLRLGASKRKIKVIPAGLSAENRHPPVATATRGSAQNSRFYRSLRSLQNDKGKRVNILFVGIWFERKGGPLVVEAFGTLAQKYRNIKLTIVGPVPASIDVRHPRIEQVDYVPRERLMREFFPNADIFVIIPPVVEGFGFAVLEAMSFGIPVIVSNICALPELVEDSKSGFIVEPGSVSDLTEKLEVLISNSVIRHKMGQAARARFEEKFSVEMANKKLLEVYRSAVGPKVPRASRKS